METGSGNYARFLYVAMSTNLDYLCEGQYDDMLPPMQTVSIDRFSLLKSITVEVAHKRRDGRTDGEASMHNAASFSKGRRENGLRRRKSSTFCSVVNRNCKKFYCFVRFVRGVANSGERIATLRPR